MTDRWINVLLIGTIISASFLYTLGKNINYQTTFSYFLLGTGIFMKYISRAINIFDVTDSDFKNPRVIQRLVMMFSKLSIPSVLLLIQIGFMIRLDKLTNGKLFSNRRKIKNMKGLDAELMGYLIFLIIQILMINLMPSEIYTVLLTTSFFIINLVLYLDINRKISNMVDDVILQNRT